MHKNIIPERYEGATLPPAQPVKQTHGYDWNDKYEERREAARRADSIPFPLHPFDEYQLKKMKEKTSEFFATMREENLWRLFRYFEERFEIFEADCRDFEALWQDMDMGRDLWAWVETIDGAHSLTRCKDFEAVMHLLIHPLKEAKEAARQMQEKMRLYFEAQAAFIRLGKSLAELEDERRRRNG